MDASVYLHFLCFNLLINKSDKDIAFLELLEKSLEINFPNILHPKS